MTRLLIVLSLLVTGCAVDGPDETFDTAEQEISGFVTAPSNYYYTTGGTTWFQDSYSGKWCTAATAQAAVWDYATTCNWTGWKDTSYHDYCDGHGGFWENNYYHYHCP